MFKRYLNYELQNIENEVGNWFSLAEFVGETLYSGNYVNFILSPGNGGHFKTNGFFYSCEISLQLN
jgi:hypothetical protein